jgi:CelD/BcsL family acetyltransferase involved in cellulose biosynthesis
VPRPPSTEHSSDLLGDTEWPVDAAIINPLIEPAWDKWIGSHPDATIFHTSGWARVLVDTYRHQPFYLRLSVQGEPFALVPMMEVRSPLTGARGICLPFSDNCAPLMLNNFGTRLVTKTLRQVGRKRNWSYFELRDAFLIPEAGAVSESYWGHTLDLQVGRAALRDNFSSSVRRALRKAEQSSLRTAIRTDTTAMTEFYRLHVRTRRKHGVPPQPRAFFSNIQKHIIDVGLGFIVVVKKAQRAIAAAMFFQFGEHAIYKFGASDETYQELRPNNLAMAEAINRLAASSAKRLHFGRTDKTNEGLRRFKLSWGTQENEICYGKFGILVDNWLHAKRQRFTLHNRIFRVLPAAMNRLVGVLLYPHLD